MSDSSSEKNPLSSPLDRKWSIENEIQLFSLVCDYKPAGHKKQENIKMIINKVNESLTPEEKPFTEKDIWQKLGSLYNLSRIDQIEELLSGSTSSGEESSTTTKKQEEVKIKEDKEEEEEEEEEEEQ